MKGHEQTTGAEVSTDEAVNKAVTTISDKLERAIFNRVPIDPGIIYEIVRDTLSSLEEQGFKVVPVITESSEE
jgi:hypothetical protein